MTDDVMNLRSLVKKSADAGLARARCALRTASPFHGHTRRCLKQTVSSLLQPKFTAQTDRNSWRMRLPGSRHRQFSPPIVDKSIDVSSVQSAFPSPPEPPHSIYQPDYFPFSDLSVDHANTQIWPTFERNRQPDSLRGRDGFALRRPAPIFDPVGGPLRKKRRCHAPASVPGRCAGAAGAEN